MFSPTEIKSRFFANLAKFCGDGGSYQVVMNHLQRSPDADVREWASWLAPKTHWGVEASMRWRPDLFNPFDLAIVAAGERSKHLSEAFHYLSQYYVYLVRMGTQLYEGLQIPILLLLGGTVVLSILQALMTGGAHTFWVHCGPPIFAFGLAGAGIFLMGRLALREAAKSVPTDQLLRRLPLLGKPWQELTESRFVLALTLYLQTNMPLTAALSLSAKMSESAVIQEIVRTAIAEMHEKSLSLSEIFEKLELGSPRFLAALQSRTTVSRKGNSGESAYNRDSKEMSEGIQGAKALQHDALERLEKICNQVPKVAYGIVALVLIGKIFTLLFTFGSFFIND